MDSMDVVVYILWCNEERLAFMKTQVESMALPFPVVYFKASTPDDSRAFVDPASPVHDRLQCCFRSHVRALEDFTSNHASGHCLILEDDVCFLREGFLDRFKAILTTYNATPQIDYVTLGHLPFTMKGEAVHTKRDVLTHAGGLYYDFSAADFTIWGSQAQLFSHKTAQSIVALLCRPTSREVLEAVTQHLKTNRSYQNKAPHVMIDALLPLLFSQAIAYPPLFVENNTPSTVQPGSPAERNDTWLRAETAGMFRLADYYGR